jgi:hypothetical protein
MTLRRIGVEVGFRVVLRHPWGPSPAPRYDIPRRYLDGLTGQLPAALRGVDVTVAALASWKQQYTSVRMNYGSSSRW